MKRIIKRSGSFAALLIVWEVVSRMQLMNPSLWPPPTKVLFAFAEMFLSGDLQRDVPTSFLRAVSGLAVGTAFGIIIGIITAKIDTADHCLTPLIQLLRPLPPVAIIPLVIVWLGIGEVSKLFSISFAVFFPVWINTYLGARQVPESLIWSAQSLKVRGVAVLWKVILPASLPFILVGIRTGVAIAFVMVFVSELAGASVGVGYQISVSHLAYRVDRMLAALTILGVLGYFTDLTLTAAAKRAFPWLKLSGQA
jgi:NitT/TauT family transport system permease protein/sulfonate transport system permease protein